jgi:predicted dehydrogenase
MAASMADSIAVYGTGYAAQLRSLAARQLSVPITALGSRFPEANRQRGTVLGTTVVANDLLPNGATCVVVCTPPSQHLANARWALAAGAAVIVEPPLTATLAEADALIALGGAMVGYGENWAYSPAVDQLLAGITGLGPVGSLEARAFQPRAAHRQWHTNVLLDVGIRPLALVLLAAAPASASAVRAQMTGSGANESVSMEITFSSGLRATVEARQSEQELYDMQISGTTGVLRAELRPSVTLEINGEPVLLPGPRSPLHDAGYVEQLRSCLADFGHGRRPFMSGEFGRMVLDVAYAAHASAGANGAAVSVPFAGRRDLSPQEAAQR